MKDHIRAITQDKIKRKKKQMRKIRTILILCVFVGLTIALLVFKFWGAILAAGLLLLTIFYTIPVNRVHIYPEDINKGLQKRLHTLYEEEKKSPSLDILMEEDEIKQSLEALHNNVLDE